MAPEQPESEHPRSEADDPVAAVTRRASKPPELSAATHLDDSRFAPGTLVAGRYRVVGRLGTGGMGEVYRADDLKLGQSVALKFLPEHLASDGTALRRLHDEVRVARDIAHPHICRIYDIVDDGAEHFITMEYVDGEDLASSLRRIGRFPKDKAIQMARQLCAGLAAAHDKGILHRDLKPANVMLDGRGNVRITDFGVAAVAAELDGRNPRAGTPAYMAPEQLAGRSVSRRSDIYSLGLLLYEIFTGREPFDAKSVDQLQRLRQSGPPTTPSSMVDDMDPIVERVILRCLENDPRDRPGSAIAVAAALPGGDPLAHALAAGETPSPEMVAQAGASGGLRPAVAISCLAGVLVTLVLIIGAGDLVSARRLAPFDKSAQVLENRAQEISRDLGYTDAPRDRKSWFRANTAYLEHIEEADDPAPSLERLRAGRPPAITFGYRSSPRRMVPDNRWGTIFSDDPPFNEPGMIRAELDSEGRLLEFEAVPPGEVTGEAAETAADWSALFAAADLDAATLEAARPTRTPTVHCDTRAAWTGTWPDAPDVPLRVEAGAFAGRPVYFAMLGPWDRPPGEADDRTTGLTIVISIVMSLFLIVSVLGAIMAYRNLRAGRGDRRGARRLAGYLFVIVMGTWLFRADHVLHFGEWTLLSRAFAWATGWAVMAWILYMAIEPYARRHWPHAMISWTRLLSGRFRDPLVGRDILFGCLSAAALMLALQIPDAVARAAGTQSPSAVFAADTEILRGGRYVAGAFFSAQTGIIIFLGAFVLLLLMRIALRRAWLATGAFSLLMLAVTTDGFTPEPVAIAAEVLVVAIFVTCMARFGLLSTLVLAFYTSLIFSFPMTFDFSAWYAGIGLVGILLAVALPAYGFWTALAGQPLFRDQLAEREVAYGTAR